MSVRAGGVPLGRRNIMADRRRLAVSAFGVGLAVALILLLQGLFAGLQSQMTAYPDRTGAALFVQRTDARTLGEGSMPPSALARVRAIAGVDAADPVLVRWVILDLHGDKEAVDVVGFRPGGMGGPWELATGRTVRADDEVVIDETLAEDHGVALADRLPVAGGSLRVVGLSSGSRTFMTGGYAFVSITTARALLAEPTAATFLLVRTSDPDGVGDAIRAIGFRAVRPDAVAKEEREFYAGVLGGSIGLMVLIAFVAGTMIVAFTVYAAILDRLPEYGTVKAIGARSARLLRVVAGQALMVVGFGSAAGFVLYQGAARLIIAAFPQFRSDLDPATVGGVVVASVVMALLAAIAPIRRVLRLDPASVYRQ